MLDSIAIGFVIFFERSSEVKWIVRFPIYIGVMRRKRKWGSVERINVCPHSIVLFLRDKTLFLD